MSEARWRRWPAHDMEPEILTNGAAVTSAPPAAIADRFDAIREIDGGVLEEFFSVEVEAVEAMLIEASQLRERTQGEVRLWLDEIVEDLDNAYASLRRVTDRLSRPC